MYVYIYIYKHTHPYDTHGDDTYKGNNDNHEPNVTIRTVFQRSPSSEELPYYFYY